MKRYYKGDKPTCDNEVCNLMVGTMDEQRFNKLGTKILFKIKPKVSINNPLLDPFTKISHNKAVELGRTWSE
jgi:hypothetical protein